jgi:Ion channel
LLNELGYTNVRDYRAGLEDWVEAGERTERAEGSAPDADGALIGPPLSISADGILGRAQARVSRMRRFDNSVLDLIHRRSTLSLFIVWMAMIILCGTGYWFGALNGFHRLIEEGKPLGADLHGFASAIYFSFVTATSTGYGDIVPIGFARAIAVAEAITGLLLFGAVIAKFVSRRQDELITEINRTTFEERLDRVQTNLHMVISELLSITTLCESPNPPTTQIARRLESAALVFQSELRTTHDLLYQPRLMVEEGVMASILAALASALNILSDALACLPPGVPRSNPLEIVLKNVTSLATGICGECVPHQYTPRLIFWMDRIHATASRLK